MNNGIGEVEYAEMCTDMGALWKCICACAWIDFNVAAIFYLLLGKFIDSTRTQGSDVYSSILNYYKHIYDSLLGIKQDQADFLEGIHDWPLVLIACSCSHFFKRNVSLHPIDRKTQLYILWALQNKSIQMLFIRGRKRNLICGACNLFIIHNARYTGWSFSFSLFLSINFLRN